MRNKKWENDFSPVDPDGHSYVDTLYSKAYLHHLIKAKEMLGLQIASIHNLAFYLWLVKEARAHIHRWRFYYMEKWYGPSISEPVIKNETDEI